ncbi:hypothetical protein F5B22DRAFT_661744 [Xylaria bambusicola]|uniref:uncharacterized protein n=1 Tax=Xylaria bambusicola TaxID=326684 RepID=UPI0020076BF8|nr:uncharacterized protein F5B22DRAFT_661744 [Xylaria bambusicola]KAI0505196.1 hypothetical protein F5B22DRAFT_661744 [Xylaria bambusicola]
MSDPEQAVSFLYRLVDSFTQQGPSIAALTFIIRQFIEINGLLWKTTVEGLAKLIWLHIRIDFALSLLFAQVILSFFVSCLCRTAIIIFQCIEIGKRYIPGTKAQQSSSDAQPPCPPLKMKAARLDQHMRDTPVQTAPFTPARSFHHPSAPTSTRKVSASFSTDCPLSGHPTIACSSVTATTMMKSPHPPPHRPSFSNKSSTMSSTQSYGNMEAFTTNSRLKSSRTYTGIPMSTGQQKVPSCRPSVSTAYTATPALPSRRAENIPPSTSMASITTKDQSAYRYPTPHLAPKLASPTKKTTKSRLSISKSRTFNALSNLTATISRTSLGQLTGNESRGTSISSKKSGGKDPPPYTSSQSTSSTSSQALPSPGLNAPGPGQIHTAQSSAYWAGRFMALQDRFQSETLQSENLTALANAHAERSMIGSIQPNNLSYSATTNCITPATCPKTTTSRVPPPKFRRSTTTNNMKHTTALPIPPRSSHETAAAQLAAEDARCQRIFAYLESLCVTSEARGSLRHWQKCYAGRMGKEYLFSSTVQKDKRTRELTWVGRLLMGGDNHGKRGSLGL